MNHPDIFSGSPAFATRGVMLDISRNRVPTMATLFAFVDQLAAWRINHLQLYTEHTFAYQGHEVVWADASPMTAGEVHALDAYCAARGIELAANQNSLGHLHRWLKHPNYAHLAECPNGYMTPWGERRDGPFSLDPTLPASLDLLRDLYDQLLPNFTSPLFNVNCDEAFDLGQGASAATCAARGKGLVYLDYLLAVHQLVTERGKTMLFWGDIILHHPELIPELPHDLIALVWGYEADHPFDEECARFAAAGLPFWVCPGTSCWNSITGRFTNARANLQNAATAGLRHGAVGFLITEWGDNGHWQPAPFTRLALAAGAVTAWTGHTPDDNTLAALVADAPLLIQLGDLYQIAAIPLHNTSPIFPLLRFEKPATVLASWTPENLARTLAATVDLLPGITSEEIHLGATLVHFALRRGLALKNGQALQDRHAIDAILDAFTRQWRAHSRPGGFTESISPLLARRAETVFPSTSSGNMAGT